MKLLQALLALLACAFLPLYAGQIGDLTYTTIDDEVTITDCNTGALGALVIPDAIEGDPVTSIGLVILNPGEGKQAVGGVSKFDSTL